MFLKVAKYIVIVLFIFHLAHANERIISLSPNITEILFILGLDPQIVGITKECNYPKKINNVNKVGSYGHINVEQIVLLKPTVVFGMKEGYTMSIKKQLDQLNIENHFFDSHNYHDVINIIKYLSERFNKDSKDLIAEIDKLFSEKTDQDKSALFLVNLDPLIAAGKNSFINDILRCGGFKNYLIDSPVEYPKINIEKLYLNKPDYILISHNAKNNSIELFKKYLEKLNINSKVIVANEDIFVRPSYRIVEACYFLRELKK